MNLNNLSSLSESDRNFIEQIQDSVQTIYMLKEIMVKLCEDIELDTNDEYIK